MFSLKQFLTVVAPAAGWRPKPLVHHVEMESVNAILHHFGEQRFHPIPIGGIEAYQIINRFAVGLAHFPFRMVSQFICGILKLTIGDDRQTDLVPFINRFAQDVTLAQTGWAGQKFGMVEGEFTITNPEHKVVRVRLHTTANNVTTVELGGIFRHVISTGKLRTSRADLHAYQRPSEPWLRIRYRRNRSGDDACKKESSYWRYRKVFGGMRYQIWNGIHRIDVS